jgi:hypothetical protein
VRNKSGTEVCECKDPRHARYLVRSVAAAPCTLKLGLGAGTVTLTITDLVTGAVDTRTVAGNASVELGVSADDFAVRWAR